MESTEQSDMPVRFRITVRADQVELRGQITGFDNVTALSEAVKPLGWMVVASVAE